MGRRVLANSYIAAYAMPESDRKRWCPCYLQPALSQHALPTVFLPRLQQED